MLMLSVITVLPLLGALAMLLLSDEKAKSVKQVAVLTSGLTFLVSIGLLCKFDSNTYAFQMVENLPWIQQLGVRYHLGIDGISLWLVLLTTFLSFIAIACSLKTDTRVRAFMACILMLESAMIGSFVSLDLILFFIFFELTLIPMWL